jgi:hypothetical protein
MVTLGIVVAILFLAILGLGMSQWADGAQSIDEEETKEVENEQPPLTFSSGEFDTLDEVEGDYSHIRI